MPISETRAKDLHRNPPRIEVFRSHLTDRHRDAQRARGRGDLLFHWSMRLRIFVVDALLQDLLRKCRLGPASE
jgi:hypothetical protein